MLLGCSGEALSELHGRFWIRLSWWALGSSGEAPGMSGDVLDEVLGRLQNLAGVVLSEFSTALAFWSSWVRNV